MRIQPTINRLKQLQEAVYHFAAFTSTDDGSRSLRERGCCYLVVCISAAILLFALLLLPYCLRFCCYLTVCVAAVTTVCVATVTLPRRARAAPFLKIKQS
ncbi:hypothetical protein [Methanimicrococcus blatticola]|uniref:hypothetical protein n=1 Tax=Methanimicrococcus blatticola TaxID=91560 RepID=UPI00106112BB|nr:hypothetical protein [Methanimicrococcus blatticola]MBZ3936042.1 hypothetical protein [Methanimicrococcus blatticola]MCC2509346.1 hypothetical protein [Methanimicrococcus blatticola]